MPDAPQLLTEEDYQRIKNALDVIVIAQQHIDQAKRAGIEISEQQAQLSDTRTRLLQIKNAYFPGR